METNGATETPIIPEEVLSQEQQQEIVKNELALVPEEERNEILKVAKTADIILIDSHKKKIKSFKARFPAKKYTITDDLVYNEEVYIKALEQWREVKNHRTKNAEPEFKKLKAPYVALTKFYNDTTNPIIADYKAIEKPMSDFLDKLEALKKEAAEKEKKDREKKINDRVDLLIKTGATFNDGYYEAGSVEFNVPVISLGMVDIESASDQLFENIIAQVKEKNELVSKAKAEKEEEELRIKAEKEKEAEEEKTRIANEQKKLDEEKEKIAEANKKIKERLLSIRSRELKSLGFIMNVLGDRFVSLNNRIVLVKDVEEMEDDAWDEKIKQEEKLIQASLLSEERHQELIEMGLVSFEVYKIYTYRGRNFYPADILMEAGLWENFKNLFFTEKKKIDEQVNLQEVRFEKLYPYAAYGQQVNMKELFAYSDTEFITIFDTKKAAYEKKITDDANDVAEKEKIKKAEELKAQGEEAVFEDWKKRIAAVEQPVFKSEKYQEKSKVILNALSVISKA